MESHIREIIVEVEKSCLHDKLGGPFGALVFKDGEVVGRGVNKVLDKSNPDSTAHAEIVAIRDAERNLGTHDLTGCELYATGYPCPMCMAAIIWANIKKVYFSADYKDAEAIGFRDDYIFNFIKDGCKNQNILELKQVDKSSIIKIYEKFVELKGEIY